MPLNNENSKIRQRLKNNRNRYLNLKNNYDEHIRNIKFAKYQTLTT